MYCLPTGGFDPRKHADVEACAKAELSEEVRGRMQEEGFDCMGPPGAGLAF
jgi:hypothetical protein